MHATWPAVGHYDKILVQSSQYLMDAAHDFRKRLKAYTATGKGKVCSRLLIFIPTTYDLLPVDNLCKEFGPRLVLIWILTIWHFDDNPLYSDGFSQIWVQ